MYKVILITVSFLMVSPLLTGQSFLSMTENEELTLGNLKASYNAQFIKNRKDQDAYDLEITVKNNGFDLIKFKNDIGRNEFDLSGYWLANVKFKNATGSNFTDREGHVDAKELNRNVTFECTDSSTKNGEVIPKSKNIHLGYGLLRNQSVSQTYRIRIPKGEKPVVEFQFANYN